MSYIKHDQNSRNIRVQKGPKLSIFDAYDAA